MFNGMNNNLLIENTVRRVLLEYLGVSDEILEMSEEIFNMIMQQHNNTPWREGMAGKSQRFDLDLSGSKASSLISRVAVRLYPYDSEHNTFKESVDKLKELDLLSVAYSPAQNMVKLFIPWPYDDYLGTQGRHFLLTGINHEVKHALQNAKMGGTRISDYYMNSVKPVSLENDDEPLLKLMKLYIRNSYYMFDIGEVDARLQEIYIELKENHGELEECKSYHMFVNSIKGYNLLKRIVYPRNSFDKRYYAEARAQLPQLMVDMLGSGMTVGKFFRYCDNGLRRYNEHLRRVVARYREDNYVKGSGSFGNYARGEVPMQYGFQNPKNGRRGIFSKIKNYFNKR